MPLNATTGSVRLRLDVNTISSMWWQFQGSLDDTFALQQSRGLMGVRGAALVTLGGRPPPTCGSRAATPPQCSERAAC